MACQNALLEEITLAKVICGKGNFFISGRYYMSSHFSVRRMFIFHSHLSINKALKLLFLLFF